MKLIKLVHVTAEHIKSSEKTSACKSSMALALKEVFGGNTIFFVMPDYVEFNNYNSKHYEFCNGRVIFIGSDGYKEYLSGIDNNDKPEVELTLGLFINELGVYFIDIIPNSLIDIQNTSQAKQDMFNLLYAFWLFWERHKDILDMGFGQFLYTKKKFHNLPISKLIWLEFSNEEVRNQLIKMIWEL